MDKLAELEKIIGDINCPSCLHSELNVEMRADLGFKDCFYLAICRHCNHTFDIDTDTKPIVDQYPALQRKLRETGCPNCGGIKLDLTMRCEMTGSKECFWVATCDLCAYSFRMKGMTGPLPPALEASQN